MSKLNINLDNHGQPYTVSEMRIRLAQVLSKLDGGQLVTFSFRADLPDYKPADDLYVMFVSRGFKVPDSLDTRHATMNPALGAPYKLGDVIQDTSGGLWNYVDGLREGENVVHGPLARPEND